MTINGDTNGEPKCVTDTLPHTTLISLSHRYVLLSALYMTQATFTEAEGHK